MILRPNRFTVNRCLVHHSLINFKMKKKSFAKRVRTKNSRFQFFSNLKRHDFEKLLDKTFQTGSLFSLLKNYKPTRIRKSNGVQPSL